MLRKFVLRLRGGSALAAPPRRIEELHKQVAHLQRNERRTVSLFQSAGRRDAEDLSPTPRLRLLVPRLTKAEGGHD